MNRIGGMADFMEDYANHLKAQLPKEQQAILDALLLAAEIRNDLNNPKLAAARLRGAAMAHKRYSPVIAAQMDLIANELEATR